MQNMIHYIFLTFEPISLLVFFDNYLTYGENEESKYYTMDSYQMCIAIGTDPYCRATAVVL